MDQSGGSPPSPRKGLWGGLSVFFLGVLLLLPAVGEAGETARIFPELSVAQKTWNYDYSRAVALSDRFLQQAQLLSGYTCRTRTFYSLNRILSRDRNRRVRERPNEDFDLTVSYRPLTAFVRLIHPRKGATVFYRSVDGVTEVHPFSFLPLTLSLSPHNGLITSRFGHSIDHSDFQSYDKRVLRPACLTHSCLYLGSGVFRGHPVEIVNIAPDQLEARPVFGRMWLLLDRDTTLPVSVATVGPDGRFWERIDYGGCRLLFR